MSGMVYWDDDHESEPVQRLRFEGEPNEPDRPNERGLFRAFAGALRLRRVRIGVGMDGLNAEAERQLEDDPEAVRAKAEAEKLGAEAAEIHARVDNNDVGRAIAVNEEVRRIFADEHTPDGVKMLELARLMDADPQLSAQLDRINEINQRLAALRDLRTYLPTSISGEAEQGVIEYGPVADLDSVGSRTTTLDEIVGSLGHPEPPQPPPAQTG